MIRGLINKAKRKLHMHESGQLRECKPGKHLGAKDGYSLAACASADCRKDICEYCQIEAPNSNIYCMQCFTSKPELRQTLVTVEDDEADDLFSFDNGNRDSKTSTGSNFTKVGVQYDKNTGSFVGIENFYQMVGGSGSAAADA